MLSVSAVAADELSKGPGQLVCPPDQNPLYSYWFTLSVPNDCQKSPTEECFYYLAVRRNPFNGSFADFYFVATTHGYVAVGFSKDSLMGEDDVIGCKRDPQTGNISVVSAWNPAPWHAPNERDPSQRGVCQYLTSYSDGQLSCRFSRYIAPVNPGYDYDLNNSYYLFYARSDEGGSPHFLKHEETPHVSYYPINVLHNGTTNAGYIPRGGLIKAHGVVMMLAWLLIYIVLLLFASISLRKENSDLSRKDWWFQSIRKVSIATIVVMAIGLLLVIIANKDNHPPGLISSIYGMNVAHAVIGFIIPLIMATCLFLLHLIVPPFCTRKVPLCITVFTFTFFVIGAGVLAGTNLIIGLVLFQTGSAPVNPLNDNLIFVILAFSIAFMKLVLASLKPFRLFTNCCIVCCCLRRQNGNYHARACQRRWAWFVVMCLIFLLILV